MPNILSTLTNLGKNKVLLIILTIVAISTLGISSLSGEPRNQSVANNLVQTQPQPTPSPYSSSSTSVVETKPITPTPIENDSEPPLKLKNLGINLDYYDPATGKAGDILFTKGKLQFGMVFTGFGFVIPGNQSAGGKDKSNPQPTWQVPMGTAVHALVDGEVIDVPKLYSGDYSILVGVAGNSRWRYETEHVINPLVKPGGKVRAGQTIAQVSGHNSEGNSGLGLVEIGILKGGNPPEHLCPFAYLDPSIKDEVEKKLRAFYKSWEEYRGDSTLYNEEKESPIGCLTTKSIEG